MAGQITGFENVMRNLNAEIAKIQGRSMVGLIKGSIIIRRDMEQTPPLIPVDKGNLRASWFTSPFYVAKGPALVMGFSANYAVFVHENMMAKNWGRPGAGPKFFEASIKRNQGAVLKVIQENAKIR